MNCNNEMDKSTNRGNGSAFLIVIVLYILLSIIIGSRSYNSYF